MWVRIFEQALIDQNLVEAYKKSNPNNELLKQNLDEVLKTVTTNTVVDSTTIQSLLVNPDTNIVKTGSSDTSVFTIKAEMMNRVFSSARSRMKKPARHGLSLSSSRPYAALPA